MNQHKPIFQKILVATDFSECASAALAQAVSLARLVGAEVTAMHVVPFPQDTAENFLNNPWYLPANGDEIAVRIRRTADERLREALAPHRASGVKLNYKTLWGTPFLEVIHAVQDEEFDLVIVGTRGLSAVSRFLIGSTASKLARKCPCPVWTVKCKPKATIATILAPVDFSGVSRKSLILAAQLAARTDCSLHVLHVYGSENAYALDLLPEADGMEIGAKRRLQRRQSIEHLREFVGELILPVEPELHVERGEPWKQILSTAKRIGAGLTIMGTIGRSGITGMLVGNTAEKVLHSSEGSLLAIKPDGFVSPVQRQPAALQV